MPKRKRSSVTYASEFIQSDKLKNYLHELGQKYDVVIVDCPPVNLVPDGLIASTYCDGTLFCLSSGASERKELEKAKEALESVKATVLGIVMTRMPTTKKYYSYKYKYGYGYYGHSESKKKKKKAKGA